jgi:hypothetical protein
LIQIKGDVNIQEIFMFKKIFGWVAFILGIVFALCGVLAVGGGASLSVLVQLLVMGVILVSIGWRMRGSQNQ